MSCRVLTAIAYNGSFLTIAKVNRLNMGAYLCIASNGIPPTVSKRVMLIVHCKYAGLGNDNDNDNGNLQSQQPGLRLEGHINFAYLNIYSFTLEHRMAALLVSVTVAYEQCVPDESGDGRDSDT